MAVVLEAARRPASDRAVVFACRRELPALRRLRGRARSRRCRAERRLRHLHLLPADAAPEPRARRRRVRHCRVGDRRRLRRPRARPRGGPRRPISGWRCRRRSRASTGGCSISTPTSSCRAATSRALLERRHRAASAGGGARQHRSGGRRAGGAILPAAGARGAPYFNSGVMLIDVAAFNAQEVLERCLEFGRGAPAGADRARPGPAERGAAGRLGGDLAGLELAVHLGVAALRGDGGRARRAFHRAEEAVEA